jgi:hypothetical protein
MPLEPPMTVPARPSPFTHLKRAFGWNLGRVTLATSEQTALEAAGVTSPVVQRYAAWRRSLLLVALVPTLCVVGTELLDGLQEERFDGLLPLGYVLEGAWFFAMLALAVACVRGVTGWRAPGTGSSLLTLGWAFAVIVPVLWFLIPDGLTLEAAAEGEGSADSITRRIDELVLLVQDLARYGGMALLLLPGLLSVIPGAINGCLRVKSLLPGAQLPGWLLVCGAPLFLLIWLALLAFANIALQSPLIVLGVCLWAGAPIWYALRGNVFVHSQLSLDDVARITRVKRVVALLAISGIALMIAGIASVEVVLPIVGLDEETALSSRLAALEEDGQKVGVAEVTRELESSESFAYALDLSSWGMILDVLAKLLLSTAIFAHLAMRATLAAWRNDRALRTRDEATQYDADAAALGAALAPTRG